MNATWVPYNYYTDIVPFINSDGFQKGRFLLYVDEEKDYQTIIIAKLSDGNVIHIRNKNNFPPQHSPVFLLVNNFARQFQSDSMQLQMQQQIPVEKQSTSYSKVYQSKQKARSQPRENTKAPKQSKFVPQPQREPPKQSKSVPQPQREAQSKSESHQTKVPKKESKSQDDVAQFQANAKSDIEIFRKDKSKKTFRKLSLKYHPDKLSNKSPEIKKIGQQTFKQLNRIYNI